MRAFEAAGFGLVIGDPATDTIRFANPRYAQIRGTTVEAVRGTPIRDAYPPAERARVAAILAAADRTGNADYDSVYCRADGSLVPVQVAITCLRDPDGTVRYRIASVLDISDRAQADKARRESEHRLRQMLESLPQLVWSCDAEGRCDYLSPQWVGYTGKSMAEQTHYGWLAQVHPDDQARLLQTWHKAVASASPITVEFRIRRHDGVYRWFDTRAAPLRDLSGQVVRWFGTNTDIEDRRETEAMLRQAQKMEAVGNLTGGMAHDFNNLLSVILGNLDLLHPLVESNPEAEELLGEVLQAAQRGADLTQRLLAFARQQPLSPQRLVPNDLVAGMVRLLGRTLGEAVTISLDLAEDLWPVSADPAQLESSLLNLATNARDAMPKGGRLMIATRNCTLDAQDAASRLEVTPGDYAVIEVSDTGTGMPPAVLERIFEPFFTTKDPGQGTGLGLSMVFGFLKQSGGHIGVYSEVDRGTTFRLYLPRALDTAAADPVASAPVAARGTGQTILVVEDNAALRKVVVRQLIALGYRPLEAAGPAEALEILQRETVDLLFSDIVMPGDMDGIALARLAASRWPTLKVVLTSGFAEARVKVAPIPLTPAVRLLNKPYRAAELAGVVRDILGT